MTPLTLDLRSVIRLTHEQFEQIARDNLDIRVELTANGELELMPPTGGNTGRRITYQVEAWNLRVGLGEVFDSSTTFRLPNGAERSLDVAWVASRSLECPDPGRAGLFSAPLPRLCD